MDATLPPDGIDTPEADAGAPANAKPPVGNRGLYFIAMYTLAKAVLFLFVSVGVFHLVGRDTPSELTKVLRAFRFRGDSKIIREVLVKTKVVTDPGKRMISQVLLLYAVLYIAEGTGLLLRKRWAEYFALVVTAIPLPFELYVLLHHNPHPEIRHLVPADQSLPGPFSSQMFVLKLALLIVNVAILWYLGYHLWRSAGTQPAKAGTAEKLPAGAGE